MEEEEGREEERGKEGGGENRQSFQHQVSSNKVSHLRPLPPPFRQNLGTNEEMELISRETSVTIIP